MSYRYDLPFGSKGVEDSGLRSEFNLNRTRGWSVELSFISSPFIQGIDRAALLASTVCLLRKNGRHCLSIQLIPAAIPGIPSSTSRVLIGQSIRLWISFPCWSFLRSFPCLALECPHCRSSITIDRSTLNYTSHYEHPVATSRKDSYIAISRLSTFVLIKYN